MTSENENPSNNLTDHEKQQLVYLKGRGAQFNPKNRFLKTELIRTEIESIDDLAVVSRCDACLTKQSHHA